MFTNAQQFTGEYGYESGITTAVMANLTDQSLSSDQGAGLYNLGQIAWHISISRCYILNQCGFTLPDFGYSAPDVLTADQIRGNYADVLATIMEQAPTKSEAELQVSYRMFDHMDMTVAEVLRMLISHEVHHRGQMTILMRRAGVQVPDIYGPNAENTRLMMEQQAKQG